jgi:mycothiol maleylpyruvate isomerase-like protein
MNDTGCFALTETTRDELRERIGLAQDRFDRLVRTADPQARPPGSAWTVQQVLAHVLTVAHRYQQYGRGLEFRRAVNFAEMHEINQAELKAVMAPVPELADQLRAVEAEMEALFDRLPLNDRPEIPFHGGILVSDITGITNWLGELLIHGLDIARAVKVPWELPERDMLLVLRGMMQITPAALRAGVPHDTDICVAITLPEARPYLIHVHHGIAETRELRPGDRPDAVLRLPASTLQQMLYGRMGPIAAVRNGLRIVGGRRPWKALKLQSCFETG